MGEGYKCMCPTCGYSFYASLGRGMFYPMVVIEETEKMKAGAYGDQGKRFFEEHPDGKITCNNVVTRCNSCKNLEVKKDFNLLVMDSAFIQGKKRLMERIKTENTRIIENYINKIDSLPDEMKYVPYESYTPIKRQFRLHSSKEPLTT